MLIAQITDIHLTGGEDEFGRVNRRRLDQVLRAVYAIEPAPDVLIVSGDLAEDGQAPAYEELRVALQSCPVPILACVGNHDSRSNFRTAFPETPTDDGFVQYVVTGWPLRIIVVDTVEIAARCPVGNEIQAFMPCRGAAGDIAGRIGLAADAGVPHGLGR